MQFRAVVPGKRELRQRLAESSLQNDSSRSWSLAGTSMTTLINRLKCATGSTYVPEPAWERDRPSSPGARLARSLATGRSTFAGGCLGDPEVALGDDQCHAGDLD